MPVIRAGAVAQSGERLLCKQEVIGSIPFSSTKTEDRRQKTEQPCLSSVFCDLVYGDWLYDIVKR